MDTSALSGLVGNGQTSQTQRAADSLFETKDQFLTLLTTQMQNQDPLNPMDSTKFTEQLVSFADVEQSLLQTEAMNRMVELSSLNFKNQALGYIGLDVMVSGTQFTQTEGQQTQLRYSLPEQASDVTLKILNSNGTKVAKLSGITQKGTHTVAWDGSDGQGNPLPAGQYRLAVEARAPGDEAGKTRPITAQTFVPGRVNGVETGDNGRVDLVVNGRKVPADQIQAAYAPAF